MMLVADTNVLLDFLDGIIQDPYDLIQPYRIILIPPVALHEVLRTFPVETHSDLIKELAHEFLPPPRLEDWTLAAQILKELYPLRKASNIARMQNDILIALSAKNIGAPVWSRDSDFELICNHLQLGLITN